MINRQIPRIVIVGAGYGGLTAAMQVSKRMKREEAQITLLNKHDYHYITTHLHMPAAGTDDPDNSRFAISSLIDASKIRFVKTDIQSIDPVARTVTGDKGVYPFDYLIAALGSEPETFGIPGIQEHALMIRSLNSVGSSRPCGNTRTRKSGCCAASVPESRNFHCRRCSLC